MALPADATVDERHAPERRCNTANREKDDKQYFRIAAHDPALRKERRAQQKYRDPRYDGAAETRKRTAVAFIFQPRHKLRRHAAVNEKGNACQKTCKEGAQSNGGNIRGFP